MSDRCIVTMGCGHHGPHVDQLYALAERCGAVVRVVQPEGAGTAELPTKHPFRRVSYAGRDAHEAPHFTRVWHQELRR